MKRCKIVVLFLLLTMILIAGATDKKELKRLQERADLIWGYGEGEDPANVKDAARKEIAKAIGEWYLTKRGIEKKISYSKRDQYEQMVEVWLDHFSEDLQYMEAGKKNYEGIYYISQNQLEKLYEGEKEFLQTLIRRGEEALELNKIGLFFRNFYWALVEIDLLAGEEVTVGENIWTSEI